MRSLIRYFVPAAILMIAGFAVWTTGRLELRATDARKQLLTLAYESPAAEYDALERELRYLRAVPPLGAIDRGIREQRATSRYWRASYSDLAPNTDAAGTVARDPGVLLVAANAAYREAGTGQSDPAAVQRLEAVLTHYSEVLRRDPWQYDAAYNYEFLARRRDTMIRARGQKPGQRGQQAAAPAPPPHTLHGRPAEQPPGAQMNEFKVIVPQRSDERQERPDSGKSGSKARKG